MIGTTLICLFHKACLCLIMMRCSMAINTESWPIKSTQAAQASSWTSTHRLSILSTVEHRDKRQWGVSSMQNVLTMHSFVYPLKWTAIMRKPLRFNSLDGFCEPLPFVGHKCILSHNTLANVSDCTCTNVSNVQLVSSINFGGGFRCCLVNLSFAELDEMQIEWCWLIDTLIELSIFDITKLNFKMAISKSIDGCEKSIRISNLIVKKSSL